MARSLKLKIICWMVYVICWLLHKSYRYRWYNGEKYDQAKIDGKSHGFVIGLWHQNCFASLLSHENKKLNIMMSKSFDGEVIAFVGEKFGLKNIRGSSSRGGKEALRDMIDHVDAGEAAAITVDGPRGPAHVVKNGIISLASRTQAPILPLAVIADRYWSLKSWDKFRLPKPFARLLVCYADPYLVPENLSVEAWDHEKLKLAKTLNELDGLAQEYFTEKLTAPTKANA